MCGVGPARARPARCGRSWPAPAALEHREALADAHAPTRRRTGSRRRRGGGAGRPASARAETQADRSKYCAGALHHPLAGHDRAAARARDSRPARSRRVRDPRERPDRRVQPQGLAEHRLGVGQRGDSRRRSAGRSPSTAAQLRRAARARRPGLRASRYQAQVSACAVVSCPASISVIASSRISLVGQHAARRPRLAAPAGGRADRRGRSAPAAAARSCARIMRSMSALGGVEPARRRERQPPQELGARQQEAVEHPHPRVEYRRGSRAPPTRRRRRRSCGRRSAAPARVISALMSTAAPSRQRADVRSAAATIASP